VLNPEDKVFEEIASWEPVHEDFGPWLQVGSAAVSLHQCISMHMFSDSR
jgi:hypothetical protein